MLLFFVRHGDPIYNPDSLTDLGERQAAALVKRMEVCKPNKIYSSSSTRAIKTAEPTANVLGKEIIVMDWCHENYAFNELSVTLPNGERNWLWRDEETERLLNSPDVRKLDREWYKYPGLEQYEKGILRIQKETDLFLASLGYRHDYENCAYIAERPNDDRIALFAHEGFGAAFLSCVLDIPYPMYSTHFHMSHFGMTVIEFAGDGIVTPHILQESNDSHLFAAGIPTIYQNYVLF